MIPEETIQEVLQAVNIVDLVESYFPLKRAGTQFKAVCPFHNEKSASFNVNPQLQIFKCFGCQKGGDAFAFVMEYEGLTYPEAIRRVAATVGIEIQEQNQDPKAKARQRMRASLVTIHQKATDWYHKRLLESPDAAGARAYLKGRGLNSEIARNWKIGYAPANGDDFLEWAKSEGFSVDLMIQSGMAALKDEDFPARGLYARFRDRVMFPIANDVGDVIAFSGRILDPESKLAKYMNSPESPIFHKGKTFFGFDKGKRPILKAKKVIIYEGQLDLITSVEFGVENAVAQLGTALTSDHARTLKRYAEEVILCFDADAAGYGAAEKSYAQLARLEVLTRVVEMPQGEDPDTLIRGQGIDGFKQLVADAKHFWDYQIDHLSGTMNLSDPRDRVQFANILAKTIARVKDKVVQDGIIHSVSTQLRIPADDFRGRVVSAAKTVNAEQGRAEAYEKRAQKTENENEPAPIHVTNTDIVILCKLALTDPETRAWLTAERARLPTVEQLLESHVLTKLWAADYDVSASASVSVFLSSLPAPEQAFYTSLLMKKTPGKGVSDAMRSLLRLEIREIENRMEIEKGKLRSADLSDSDKMQTSIAVMALKKELVEKQKQLSNSE